MRPIIDDVQRSVLQFSTTQEVHISGLFERCDDHYWYSVRTSFNDDLSFKRRLLHCEKWTASVLTGWYSKEVLEIPIIRRPDLYQLVPDSWYDFIEMPPLYLTSNQMT